MRKTKLGTMILVIAGAAFAGAYADHRYRLMERLEYQLRPKKPPVEPPPQTRP